MLFHVLKPQNILLLALLTLLGQIAISSCSSSTQSPVPSTPSPDASSSSTNPPAVNSPDASRTPESLIVATASPYPRRSFPPFQDQVKPGSSFDQFRERLKQAIRDRDATFINAIADPQIQITFGRAMEFSTLGFDNPKSLAWKHLERTLNVGCARYEAPAGVQIEAYQCPHVSQSAIGDPFGDVHIIGQDVNVRSQPRSDGPVIAVLANELVKFDSAGFQQFTDQQRDMAQTLEGWMPIITPTGKRGYVSSRYAYSPAGYRARFENKQGQWKMTIFIAGD